MDLIDPEHQCLMFALYSLSSRSQQQKVREITVFLLVFLRSCAARLNRVRLRLRIMPIYEYRCDNCSHELEAFQKISEGLLVKCPECSKDSLIKKISAAGFRLKGAGWYETDFKSGNKKNVSSSDEGSSGGSDSKSKESDASSSKKNDTSSKKSDSSGSSSSASSSSD